MKTWYFLQEILGTKEDPDPTHIDESGNRLRIPHVVRTYISDEVLEGSKRVAGVEPVEAETWQEAKEKFEDLELI